MRSFRLFVALACFLMGLNAVFAVDFDDLKEKQGKVYGSEKEKRYVIDAFFVEWESFPRQAPTHNSFHFFWLYNTADYPKYARSQFFPFYFSETSKVDERREINYLLISHYSKEANGSYSYKLFPFYWTGKQANGSSYHSILPLYYSQTQVSEDKKENLILFPGFYKQSSESIDKKSEQVTSVSPFHVYSSSKSAEGDASRFWFPALPLYYSYVDYRVTHKNYFWVIDTEFDLKKDSYSQVWVAPFVFWKKDSYLNIFPFYFFDTSPENKTSSVYGLIPPFYYSYAPEKSVFYLLNFYSDSKVLEDKKENFTTFAPFVFHWNNNKGYSQTIVPLLFYAETNEDKSTYKNILLAYDQTTDSSGNLDRLLIAPFFYYKKNSSLYIAPFYFSNFSKDETQGENFGLLPPFYSSYSPSHKTFYTLNYYSNTKFSKDSSENFTMLAPLYFNSSNNKGYSQTIVPLLLYSETKEDTSTHKNILLSYDHAFDNKGNLDRLFISPIYFYRKDYFFHIAPLYWSWINNVQDTASNTVEKNYRTLFLPIIYREANADNSSYTNVLGVVSREKDEKGKLKGSMAFPFYFYKRDSYDIVFPFTFKFGPDEEAKDTGTRFGLMYYNNWNPREETLWIANWFSYQDKENNTHFKSLNPIYYNWKTKNSSGEVTPLYLTIQFANQDRFHLNFTGYSSNVASGILKPDLNLGVGEKEGYKYLDTDVSWLWYVFKMSTRTSTKIFYDLADTGNETSQGKDITSDSEEANSALSPKISKRKTFTREDSIDFLGVNLLFGLYGWEAGDSKRHIRAFPLAWFTWDTKSDDRVYTVPPLFVNYYSQDLRYTVLFPFYGYQKTSESERTAFAIIGYIGESLKENRTEEKSILWPLANWHSSDVKSGSRILPFYWYRNRSEGRDKISTLISPLFYYNNTLDRKGTEDSYVLSPVWFRFYSRENDESSDKHFTLPFYYFQKTQTKYENKNLFVSLPFIYYGVSDTHGKAVYNRNFWMIPALALYNSDNYITNWNFALFVNSIETKENSNFVFFPVYYHDIDYDKDKITSVTRWFLPSYYKKNYAKKDTETTTVKLYHPLFFCHSYENKSTAQNDNYWFAPLPGLYHSYQTKNNESYWNWLVFASYEKSNTAHNIKVYPVFYQDFYEQDAKNFNYTNWFLPFYFWNSTKTTKLAAEEEKEISETNFSFYSLLWIYTNRNNLSKKWFIPPALTYHSYEKENNYSYWNVMLFSSYENSNTVNNLQVLPVYYHNFNYDNKNLTSSTVWAIPVYYDKEFAKTPTDTTKVKLYSPLFFYHSYENKSTAQNDNYWFAPVPLLYHSYKTKNGESYWNLLGLTSYENSNTAHNLKIYPIFYQDFYEQDAKNFNYTNWFAPLYYWNNKKTTSLVANETGEKKITESEFSFYSLAWVYTNRNDSNKKWFVPPALVYHSESPSDTYTNWLLFISREKSATKTAFNLFPVFGKSTSYHANGKQNESNYWSIGFPLWLNKKYATDTTAGETSLATLPMYLNYKYDTEQSDNSYLNMWIMPLIFNYTTNKNETSWSWLFFSRYSGNKDRTSMLLLPVSGFDFDKRNKERDYSSLWILPAFYYKKEENRNTGKSDKTFISLLYNEFESENKKEKTFEKSILFPILPFLFYKNKTQNGEHTKILTILDYVYKSLPEKDFADSWSLTFTNRITSSQRRSKKETLVRLTLFPYWYSLNTDNPDNPVIYRHLFPVYFSKEDKTENTSLVSGLYLNSNLKSSMQNFLMLAEHTHSKESGKREVDFLFRSIHLAKAKEEVNVRLLYGLGNYSSTPEETDMNLLWIASKNKKEFTQKNILPLYYNEENKKDKQMWITPALYYSKTSESKQTQHAALGALYYKNSDQVKKEEHMNLLMGILYYKTSLAKERGYEGQGSLWGLLWEYKTESETKYSKFAVMKFVYSKTTDETGESYQRILGVRL